MVNRSDAKNHALVKRCFTFALLALALMLGPVLLRPNAQSNPADKGQAQKPSVMTPAATGAISGTVVAASNSAPLQGVEVVIFDSNRNLLTSAFPNGAGVYTTPAVLATGTYFAVTTNSSGYIDELYNNVQCVSFTCSFSLGTPISVTDGATTTGINFALDEGGRISGTVFDASTSSPLANVSVHISRPDGQGVSSGFTGSSGQYTSGAGLPPGTYYASTSNSIGYIDEFYDNIVCFGCSVTVGTPITVTAGAITPGINFGLNVGGRISGTVTDSATGEPIPNVIISISNSSGASVTAGFTDSAGNYTTFAGIPAGPHFARTFAPDGYLNEVYDNILCPDGCVPSSGTPIPITLGVTTSGINFALGGVTGIAGTVTDASGSTPLTSIGVDIYNAAGNHVSTVFTDFAGNYSATGLTAGTYFVATASSSGYIDELYNNITCVVCNETSGTPVIVNTGSITPNINFALSLGGRFSGNVTNLNTGAPIDGIAIFVFDSLGQFVDADNTDSSGNYMTNRGLPTGSYFAFTVNSQGYINKLYKDITCLNCSPTSGTPIAVTAGSITPDIKFTLQHGGRISGNITNAATSLPLEFVVVLFYDSNANLLTSALTDGAGNYLTHEGLPTGTYFARTSNDLGLVDAIYNNITCTTCSPAIGTSIPVTIGITTPTINFALCPSFSLSESGRLFGASGGEASLTVTSQGGCGWAAASNVNWIEITSNRISQGDGTLTYLVRDNPSPGPRIGTISVANQTFTVTQEGSSPSGCTFSTNPQQAAFNSAGGAGSFNVTTTPGCAWRAESNRSWIVITSQCCGITSGPVNYTVAPNTTGSGRSGVITVGGKQFNVKQK